MNNRDDNSLETMKANRQYRQYQARKRREYIEQKNRELRQKKIRAIVLALLPIVGIVAAVIIAIVLLIGFIKKSPAEEDSVDKISEDYDSSIDYQVSFNQIVSENVAEEPVVAYPYAGHDAAKYGLFEGYQLDKSSVAYLGTEAALSEYAVIIDAETGKVIASRNGDSIIYPASMTKIMTLLVAVEKLENEDSLDDIVTISSNDTNYAYSHDLSIVGFGIGEQVTVRDLLYGTILPSGGDAAHALAVYTAGSEEAFADMMNDKIAELGISSTCHFTNCSGIYNDNHYCTLYDMAIILKAAEENELCRTVLSERIYTTSQTPEHPEGIQISNWFIRRIEDKDVHGKVLGAKTGFVNESGCNAASYQQSNDGHQYICVTVNAWSSWRAIYDHVAIYDAYTQ